MSEHDTANRVAQGLAKVALALRHDAWREAGPRRLTPTQAQVLTALLTRLAPANLNEVAEALAVTPATASDAVRVLVDKGLVDKQRVGRTVALRLTGRGHRLAKQVAGWPEFLTEAIDALDDAERAGLLRSLVKMIRTMQQRGAIPVQRMCVECRYFEPNAYDDPARPHHCHYVDAPFGDAALRLDCPDQAPVEPAARDRLYELFVHGQPAAGKRGRNHGTMKGAKS